MAKPTNTRFAKGVGTSKLTRSSWTIFDALPYELRLALWEAPVSINPASAESLLREYGQESAVEVLRSAIEREIIQFADQYAEAHQAPLPHIASFASLQTYERPRHGRRRV